MKYLLVLFIAPSFYSALVHADDTNAYGADGASSATVQKCLTGQCTGPVNQNNRTNCPDPADKADRTLDPSKPAPGQDSTTSA